MAAAIPYVPCPAEALADAEAALRREGHSGPLTTCSWCQLCWYKGGVCREHSRHYQQKKGWCYAMGLSNLRNLSGIRDKGSTEANAAKDEAFQKKMPTLWEFLTTRAWEDGTDRETGTLLVFVEEGLVKVCLCNRDTGHVGFISGRTWADALASCEKHLAADTVDWRLSKGARGKKGK